MKMINAVEFENMTKLQAYNKGFKDGYQKCREDHRRKKWEPEEIEMVLNYEMPDRKLAEKFGRSIAAIRLCRQKYKKKGAEE